ncbi:DJ-1/PfpI family protein [Bacillus horti]|uniref:Transcriptional regulator GlxA family with amidase domain n=1 Tax=Caldalkalibacillus horti TaxID=77523 RepID=A0ABT9VWF7_9BACI|nr:DJ-1/PfpI family protein [Bacillus horti]MDQ0165324.1 transcriptional regulator GlxA family with amidase domain [Bacillus horti]
MQKWKVGILLFDDVEVLDFAGPFEVFSITTINYGKADAYQPFEVSTISETGEPIRATNGLKVIPDYSLGTAPYFDLLVIPGGLGTDRERENKAMLHWIYNRYEDVKWMTSVCTGAFLLAEIGLLNHRRATTHCLSIETLKKDFPEISVKENVKFVDEGKIVTAAGVSAGIHMAFHMVRRLLGTEAAEQTAGFMEYDISFDELEGI